MTDFLETNATYEQYTVTSTYTYKQDLRTVHYDAASLLLKLTPPQPILGADVAVAYHN